MQRNHLLQLLEAALAARQTEYALKVTRRYLADWPGDLGLQLILARTYVQEGRLKPASAVLERVLAADPEFAEAQRLRAKLPTPGAHTLFDTYILDGLNQPSALPEWAAACREAVLAEKVGDLATAIEKSRAALAAETPSPLPSLIHLSALWHGGQLDLALPLAEAFAARWPSVVAFKLCLAECLFAISQPTRAIQLLHEAATADIAGQVPARHWGEAHTYRALWPSELTTELPAGPLPAELITHLGLNRLPGKISAAKSSAPIPAPSEELAEIQATLEALAAKLEAQPGAAREAYVLLSSRLRLTALYGPEGFAQISAAMHALATAQKLMRPVVIFVDEAASLEPFGLQAVNAAKAWDIKLLLHGLNAKLRAAGERLGALLIVGGPDVIPFHHLPNPVEDMDADVPSDNPYATADENYFVPEWAVGRLPNGVGNNPAPLVRALKKAAQNHTPNHKTARTQKFWLARFLEIFFSFFKNPSPSTSSAESFGYSANVWKQASAAVYDVIGNPRHLQTSPPLEARQLPPEGLAPAKFSYFNLHGVEDGPEWYGQRSFDDPLTLPEYPVALRPGDVMNSGRAPLFVFSEACYGANVFNKHVDDALCLRFLDSGTRAVIGSTKVAYGSVAEPLIAADLLGKCFWLNLSAGLPVGEALRLAKLHMAQEMHQRQGCLDGEDQKTLISFVLYGDPLAVAVQPTPSAAKEAKRRALKFTAQKFQPQTAASTPLASLTPESMAQMKKLVAQYLPGMTDAQLLAARTRTAPSNAKRPGQQATVVTLSKVIQSAKRQHPHFARVTFDAQGKAIKISVSR